MVIKTLNTQNPFAGYGSIITGNRFVGRQDAIEAIHNRVLGDSFGNLAIMGLPRIGKTSLARMALISIKEKLALNNHFVFEIAIGTLSNSSEFFKLLILSILDLM